MTPIPQPVPTLYPRLEGLNYTRPTPNYVNPEIRGWAGAATLIALFIVTIFIFCARIWARFKITRNPGLDDLLIIVAMPALIGQTIATILSIRIYGFQLHFWDQTPETLITIPQMAWVMLIIYAAATALIKISILMFYRRISTSLVSPTFLIIVRVSVVFVAVWAIESALSLVSTCQPVEAWVYRYTRSWLDTHAHKCYDENLPLLVNTCIGVAQDFLVCFLPMFLVAKLRLPRRQKIALACLFLAGLGTCATGVFRIFYAYHLYYRTTINPSPTHDLAWEGGKIFAVLSMEVNLSVICACVPALRVYFPQWLRTSEHEERTFGWYGGRCGGNQGASPPSMVESP